jgi:hypothetical protein
MWSSEYIYLASIFIINMFYIALFFGVIISIPYYVQTLQLIVQLFLCIILLIRFHPFQDSFKMTRFDAQLIFGAVIIIFTNVIFQELLHNPLLGPYLSQVMLLRMKIFPFSINN